MKEDSIFITDENGKEVEMKIYMTLDANDKSYVIVYPLDNENELLPFRYDLDGNLYQVEDNDELDMLSEVIDAYEKEN